MENNLEDSFRRITVLPEDEEVAQKQVAEDLSLYGSRPNPPDAVEIDEHTQQSNLPPKRSAAEFDAYVNRPTKVRRKEESKEFSFQRITAMDWNSGATPFDAWLNQSAVPSIVPLPQTQRNQSNPSSDDLAAKELEDLKVFRTIHIEGIGEPKSIETPRDSAIDLKSSSQGHRYICATSWIDTLYCPHTWPFALRTPTAFEPAVSISTMATSLPRSLSNLADTITRP